jgi:DNA invertase Pin-like site-specific DNA recombinase
MSDPKETARRVAQLAKTPTRELEDQLKQSLVAAGERRARAHAERHAASVELAEAVRRAADKGVPPTEIANLAGISRQAVYDFLRE